ncbi:hypothetical protein [Mangrovimonas spongiae]|uniref:Lipocalin-like domain-containing protein n=1 Tax=Mangrovimonas spongiae TaxID=2494697 RepID=A0A3R9NMG4_9FLAO|nr:hypothetical protein [Mangrovimonas spongiae]RSK39327.1 hypothetical protein EJA19_10400 [Mangrovimonas spongiae]
MHKFINKLFFLASLTVVFACSSDQDDVANEPSGIEGVWGLNKITLETPLDVNNDGVASTILFETPGYLGHSELIINNETSGTIYFSAQTTYNTKEEDGKLIFMITSSTNGDRVDEPISYTLEDGIGIINHAGVESSFTVSENTLSITVANGFIAKDHITGDISVSQNLTYTFVK